MSPNHSVIMRSICNVSLGTFTYQSTMNSYQRRSPHHSRAESIHCIICLPANFAIKSRYHCSPVHELVDEEKIAIRRQKNGSRGDICQCNPLAVCQQTSARIGHHGTFTDTAILVRNGNHFFPMGFLQNRFSRLQQS